MKANEVFEKICFVPGQTPEWPLDFVAPINTKRYTVLRPNIMTITESYEDFVMVPVELTNWSDLDKNCAHMLWCAANDGSKKIKGKFPRMVEVDGKVVCIGTTDICVMPIKDGKYGLAILDNQRIWFHDSQ